MNNPKVQAKYNKQMTTSYELSETTITNKQMAEKYYAFCSI